MAPLALTDRLGPQVNEPTGGWIPNSDTYLIGQTASLARTFFFKAQVSDIYLVTWILQVTSGATSGLITPRVDYYGAWDQGAGRQLFQHAASMALVDPESSSSTIMAIRAASSDIFLTTTVTQNGAAPTFNLYVRISRPT